jgi:hypothetical protein
MAVEAEAAAADGTVFCPRPSRRAMEKSFLGETSSQGGARSASKPRKIIFMRYFSEDGKTNVIVSMYKKGARYKDKQVKPDLVFRQFDIDWRSHTKRRR